MAKQAHLLDDFGNLLHTDMAVVDAALVAPASDHAIDPLLLTPDIAGATINGTSGVDFIHEAGDNIPNRIGAPQITGVTENDDTIHGLGGNDQIVGDGGNDTLFGDDGDDILMGGAGNDTMDGGAGIDTADYLYATAGVSVDLRIAGPQDTVGAGSDMLTNVEYLQGSTFADTLNGDDHNNALFGGGGSDHLIGNGGNDWLRADGAGNATLEGDAGDDLLVGGTGNDTFTGGAGNDTIQGGGNSSDVAIYSGAHTDYIIQTNGTTFTVIDERTGSPDGTDTLTDVTNLQFTDGTFTPAALAATTAINGTAGADFIHEAGDHATPPSGTYNEITTATENNDVINGFAGNDVIYGQGGNDTIHGGDGDDQIFGGAGTNILAGDAGNDTIHSVGADTITGGDGDDTIILAQSNDSLTGISVDGGTGINTLDVGGVGVFDLEQNTSHFTNIQNLGGGGQLSGDEADNTITGDSSDDILVGRGGDDILHGGDGNDTLTGGTGNDTIDGGAGVHDLAVYLDATAGVTVDLTLQGTAQNTGGAGIDTLTGIESIEGSKFADTLTGDDNSNQIFGGGGNDHMVGNGGNDWLRASPGNATLEGDAGDDLLNGSTGNDVLNGGDGNDTMTGGGGTDTFIGGAGNDMIQGGGDSSDTAIYSGAHTDYIVQTNGTTYTVIDERSGSPDGTDTLTGIAQLQFSDGTFTPASLVSTGAFVFHEGNGANTVTDFSHGTGTIEMDGYGIHDFAALQSHITQSGSDTVIHTDANDIITLKNVAMATLAASDFVFH